MKNDGKMQGKLEETEFTPLRDNSFGSATE